MGVPSFGPVRPTDYLANERTFLAYVRTALSVMAFGFVISRFGLFLRVLSSGREVASAPIVGSEWLGLAFGLFGCLLAVIGVIRFVATSRDLARNEFHSSARINTIVGWATVVLGLVVVLSLLRLV